MRALALILSLLAFEAGAATQYICASAAGTGDGSSLANCKASGTNFASITVGASDVLRICSTIRGALTITSTNDVTVDLDCNGEAAGEITGADVVTSFAAVDVNGEYETTANFTTPTWVLIDGSAIKEGVKGELADNEWAFSASKVYLGQNPAGKTVEIATRGIGIEFASSTGASVTGGRIYGVRFASAGAAVKFNASSGSLTDTEFYAVSKPSDMRGSGTMTVTGTTTNYCVDGPDANKDTNRPTLVVNGNTVMNCNYNGWFANTVVSHSITADGEAIACTNCAAISGRGNVIKRAKNGIVTLVETATVQNWNGNYIEDTDDDGLNIGCTSAAGSIDLDITGNVVLNAGKAGGYGISSYAIDVVNNNCGNGSAILVANNTVADSSQGIRITGAASQTGTIGHYNNAYINVNHTKVAGTHYFINWANMDASHSMTIASNKNDYHQTTGVGAFRWVSGSAARTYANYSLYLSDSSQDAASILTDPRFLGGSSPTTAEGFRPNAGSPLIRAGTPTAAKYDYRGRRFNTPPSIGAYELPAVTAPDALYSPASYP
jgi:hypothetical protein